MASLQAGSAQSTAKPNAMSQALRLDPAQIDRHPACEAAPSQAVVGLA
jgi:hypothetical protein